MNSPPAGSEAHGYAPLVLVFRGEHVESVHHGAIVMADVRGRILRSAGDPRTVTFLRSSAKPFQLSAVIAAGAADRYGFDAKDLAVAAASHNGEDRHLEAVASILSKIGLTESSLLCGTHEPLGPAVARRLRQEGRKPTLLHSNCSGKHAAMLALAVHRGWPPADYTDAGHPVQREMIASMAAFGGLGESGMALAVDGCSVPTFGIPLREAAMAYARLHEPDGVSAPLAEAAPRVVAAMRGHPGLVGGEGVIDSDLMRVGLADLVAKRGAEGFYGIGFRSPEGRGLGIAFKIADGDPSGRARDALAVAIVRQLGLAGRDALAELEEAYVPAILNRRGQTVGHIEACVSLG